MRAFLLSTLELRKYRRGPMARAAVIALVLLPLLYGTVYLVAYWTPYNNLDHVPAAIVNMDIPASAQGQVINAGEQLTSTLKKSESFAWEQTDRDKAQEGLANGTYFYVLEVPADFSSSIASLSGANPKVGVLTLTSDDANSYLTSLVGEDFAVQVSAVLNQTIIQQFLGVTLDGIVQIRTNLEQAAGGAGELAGGTSQLKSGSKKLSSGAGQVAAGNKELAGAANIARKDARYAQDLSNDVVELVRNLVKQFPDSKFVKDLLTGVLKVNGVVDSVTTKVVNASEQVDELGRGAEELAKGAKQLAAGTVKLNSGAQQLSKGLASGVGQLPTWTDAQATGISNYASAPTAIRQVQLNNTDTYGAGFAPYFMSMALWVAILVVYTLLKAVPARALLAPRMGALRVTMVGYLPVLMIVALQSVILLAVIRFVLGIAPSPTNLGLLLGFLMIIGAAYAAIIQLLNATLGISGKLVALILLMLQLCSCGGTYPIEMSPPFFQAISPYLPMTYAVSGIRHLIAGGDLGPVVRSTLILIFMIMVVVGGTAAWIATHRRIKMDDLKPEIEM